MTHDELLVFIRRIVANGSESKASHTLSQLEEILREQKADDSLIHIVLSAQKALPELQTTAREKQLTDDLIEATRQKAQVNRMREYEDMMRRGGRY